MDFTVSDILAKGFKYELQITEAETPPAEGTIAAILGTAHWGPINTPRNITGGLTEFNGIFGGINSEYDEGHAAMQYHLTKSNRGYFTRIADGNQAKSYLVAEIPGSAAVSTSAVVAPSAIALTPTTNSLTLTFADTAVPYSEAVPVVFSGSALAEQAVAIFDTTGATFPLNTLGTEQTVITVNGTTYTKSWAVGVVSADETAYVADLLDNTPATGTWAPAAPPVTGSAVNGTSVTLTTTAYGSSASIVYSANDDDTGVLGAVAVSDTGLNSNHVTIISQINAAVALNATLSAYTGYVAAALGTSGANLNKIVVTSPTTGGTVSIAAAGTANATLAFPASVTGVAIKPVGTFMAKQFGRLGDTIRAIITGNISSGNRIDVFFNSVVIGTFVNFNYDVNSNAYLGKLLSDDAFTTNIVEYNHGVDETGAALPGVTLSDEIPAGDYSLENGNSGDASIDITIDLIPQIAVYDNIDIYDFDIVSAPGYSEEDVQDELQRVCEERQDTITVWDTPLLATVSNAVSWTNGLGAFGRDTKINTPYCAVYYPYVKVNKVIFESPSSTGLKNQLDDYPPSIRTIGAIAQSDDALKSTFGAPAGIRTVMDGVEGLQRILSNAEKELMYADVYDGMLNPIAFTTEDGFFIDGQKTGARRNPATGRVPKTSRLNVIRTATFIKKYAQKRAKFFFFNPTDPATWLSFQKMLEGALTILEEKRAIEGLDSAYPWKVICDSTTNTEFVRANNGLIAYLEFTPVEAIERIKIIANLVERTLTTEVVV